MPPLPPPPDPAPIAAAMVPEGFGDLDCLTSAVYYEARGESAAGQAAVAQVVLNRLAGPSFPKSVCGVVYQRRAGGCQFSFVCDGAMLRPLDPAAWRRARLVAERALAGDRSSTVGEATHFHAVRLGDIWGPRLVQVAQIGGHAFYSSGAGARSQWRAASSRAPDAKPAPVRYTFSLGLLVRVSDGAPAEAPPAAADQEPPAPATPSAGS
jgi:hypothetical protein